MKLKKRLISGIFIICAFLFASCATTTTTISDVWKDKAYQGKAQKIVVIMVAKSQYLRKMFEGRFAAELKARGKDAIQSYKIVALEQIPDKELVKSKIKGTGAVVSNRVISPASAPGAWIPVCTTAWTCSQPFATCLASRCRRARPGGTDGATYPPWKTGRAVAGNRS